MCKSHGFLEDRYLLISVCCRLKGHSLKFGIHFASALKTKEESSTQIATCNSIHSKQRLFHIKVDIIMPQQQLEKGHVNIQVKSTASKKVARSKGNEMQLNLMHDIGTVRCRKKKKNVNIVILLGPENRAWLSRSTPYRQERRFQHHYHNPND